MGQLIEVLRKLQQGDSFVTNTVIASQHFFLNIGCYSITRAKLRVSITSLRCAWEHGLRNVELQVNSTTLI
ncbi:hypothetical protein LINPERPRIM_LOCUS20046 [Linum perenne]